MFVLLESRTSDPLEAFEYLHGTAFDTLEDAVKAMRCKALTYVSATCMCPYGDDPLDCIEFGDMRGPYASVEGGWQWRIIEVETP